MTGDLGADEMPCCREGLLDLYQKPSRYLASVLAAATLLVAPPALAQDDFVRVQVIDRGQADGILIRTPNHEWVVIDAGTNDDQAEAMEDEWGVDSVALAVGDADFVRCTNRHMTVRVYGYADGRIRVTRQNPIDKSCVFDGTHY